MPYELDCRYTARPARLEDADAVCALCNVHSMKWKGICTHDAREIEVEWQSPGFCLDTDTCVIHNQDSHLIAYAAVWDTNEPHVNVYGLFYIRPEHEDEALEESLLIWLEDRARGAIDRAPADARVILAQSAMDRHAPRKALLERHGYALARHFVRLRIEMSEPPVRAPLPSGIDIRPFDRATDLPATVLATREIFRDHWGHVEGDVDQEMRQWAHWIDTDPHFDPSVWHLAWDGDDLIGISLGTTTRPEAENLAYIDTLGVRKAWRGRGIARALLTHSFAAFFERERPIVDLDADGANLTGAIRVYTSAGMHPAWQQDAYEKELRPGRDLVVRTLDTGGEATR